MVKEKKFREDLLYRINVIELRIPPLRERPEDIPLLCESIIEEINRKYHLHYKGISDAAISYLSSYSWPGNVRELKHFIERACIMTDSDILQKSDFNFICEKICETPAAETPVQNSIRPLICPKKEITLPEKSAMKRSRSSLPSDRAPETGRKRRKPSASPEAFFTISFENTIFSPANDRSC